MTQEEKPTMYLLPAPLVEDEGEVKDVALEKSWDRKILLLFFRGKPRTEIARTIGRSTDYIKRVEQLPEFRQELAELKGDTTEGFVEETIGSLKSAKEMRAEALKALHLELMGENTVTAGRIASAKVLLDEAHREDMQNRGERERPLSLNEVRRMSITEAQDLAKEHQIRRSK
jgi:hypothetical protein